MMATMRIGKAQRAKGKERRAGLRRLVLPLALSALLFAGSAPALAATPCIKHAFVSGKADAADATIVRASDWNACHTIDDASISAAKLSFDPATQAELDAVAAAKENPLTFNSPLSRSVNAISIGNAAADGSTKGAAGFLAADFDAASGIISLDYVNGQKATSSLAGFLAAADWVIFNAKESALTFSSPLTRSVNTIGCQLVSGSQAGCLSSTDWTTFNAKVATTRAINTTSPLSGGGDLSSDRTLSLLVNTDYLFTASQSIIRAGIGATSADGLVLQNTTDAAAGAQQWSPRLRWHGEGWKTDATAASQEVDWIAELQPVEGAANPSANLVFSTSINGGAFGVHLALTRNEMDGNIQQRLSFGSTNGTGIARDGSGELITFRNSTQTYHIGGALRGWADSSFEWANKSNDGSHLGGATSDLKLFRDVAGAMHQRNGTNAQKLRVANTFTSLSNMDYGGLEWVSNVAEIGAFTVGGTLRKVKLVGAGILTSATVLPTSDPAVSGQLWNNGGVVTVSP